MSKNRNRNNGNKTGGAPVETAKAPEEVIEKKEIMQTSEDLGELSGFEMKVKSSTVTTSKEPTALGKLLLKMLGLEGKEWKFSGAYTYARRQGTYYRHSAKLNEAIDCFRTMQFTDNSVEMAKKVQSMLRDFRPATEEAAGFIEFDSVWSRGPGLPEETTRWKMHYSIIKETEGDEATEEGLETFKI